MPGERLLIGQREREISVLLPRGRTSLVRTCRWWRVYVTLGACVCTVNGAARGTDSTELITDLCKMLFVQNISIDIFVERPICLIDQF